jgi:hypothetical protein
LKREKPVFVERDMGVNTSDLLREICKPVLKLHDTMEALSEFRLCYSQLLIEAKPAQTKLNCEIVEVLTSTLVQF